MAGGFHKSLGKHVQIVGFEKYFRLDSAPGSKVITMKSWDELRQVTPATTYAKELNQANCATCKPDESDDQLRHVPWDEVELKKHELLTTKCVRPLANLPKDEFELKKLGYPFSSSNVQHAPSTAASVAEEIQNGVANAPLSEWEKSSADLNRPKISVVEPSNAEKSDQSVTATASDTSSVSSCTLLSGGAPTVPDSGSETDTGTTLPGAVPSVVDKASEIESESESNVSENGEAEKSEEPKSSLSKLQSTTTPLQQKIGNSAAKTEQGRSGKMIWQSVETVDENGVRTIQFKLVGQQQKDDGKKEDKM